MDSSTGAAELQRRRQLLKQSRRERRARLWVDLRHELVNGTRVIFVFLLGATIVVFVFSHRAEINSAASQNISRVAVQVKKSGDSSLIRQTALNHEKEVDEAAK